MRKPIKELPSDLTIILILEMMAAVFILIPPFNETFLRIPFAFILGLFFPGYLFISAIFPRDDELSGIERFTLSIAMSITITVFSGFAISMMQWAFRPNSIVISLLFISIILLVITNYHRKRIPVDQRYRVPFKKISIEITNQFQIIKSQILTQHSSFFSEKSRGCIDKCKFIISVGIKIFKIVLGFKDDENKSEDIDYRPDIEKALIIGMILCIIITSCVVLYAKMTFEKDHFTALYILGPEGKAENYPDAVYLGKPGSILVGIENHELKDTHYILQVRLADEVLQELEIDIPKDEKWLENVSYTSYQIGLPGKLEFLLFKNELSSFPYSSVHLHVNRTYDSQYIIENEDEFIISDLPVITNGDFEYSKGWKFSSNSQNITGIINNSFFISAPSAYVFSSSGENNKEVHGQISQTIHSDKQGLVLLSFMIKDNNVDGRLKNAYLNEVFINDVLEWKGKNIEYGWEHPMVPVFLNKGDNTITLKFTVFQNNPPIQVILDDVEIIPFDFISTFSDISLPVSKVKMLNQYTNMNPFILEWNGTDTGIGIALYQIDFSIDKIKWIPWLVNTTAESAEFTGKQNMTYYFRCRAIDNAGNIEPVHQMYDTFTTLDYEISEFKLKLKVNWTTDTLIINLTSPKKLESVMCTISIEGFSEAEQVKMKSKNGYEWEGIYNIKTPNRNHIIHVYTKDTAGNVKTETYIENFIDMELQ